MCLNERSVNMVIKPSQLPNISDISAHNEEVNQDKYTLSWASKEVKGERLQCIWTEAEREQSWLVFKVPDTTKKPVIYQVTKFCPPDFLER